MVRSRSRLLVVFSLGMILIFLRLRVRQCLVLLGLFFLLCSCIELRREIFKVSC